MNIISIIIILFFLILVFFIYFCIKFALSLIRVKEAIEESLDILDENYNKISLILEIPIFNDNTQIKEVIESIKDTRDSILYIANSLSGSIEKEKEKSEIKDEQT